MNKVANTRSMIQPFHRHPPGSQPERVYEPYRSTTSRNPSQPLIFLPHTLSEVTGPVDGHGPIRDQHPAPLDPNFSGAGRTVTDENGNYRFVTIKPGAYPWFNHYNAWRPAHIHFSVFGPAFLSRLITQMYFPGDPLFAHDPIYQSVPDENARQRMIAKFDLETTQPQWALAYRFDIVLRGPEATPFEP